MDHTKIRLEVLISEREGMVAQNKMLEYYGQCPCFGEDSFAINAKQIADLLVKCNFCETAMKFKHDCPAEKNINNLREGSDPRQPAGYDEWGNVSVKHRHPPLMPPR